MATHSIRAQHVSFSYADRGLFDEVSFHLSPGWTGLVGANGSGKSTLLRLIAGELQPSSGTIRVEPQGSVSIALCPQEVEALEQLVEDFGSADDGLARRLHGRLELEPSWLSRWETLSPGERKRWQIGAALWREPEVLLLDEPTNHLDADASRLLRTSLATHRGVGLLVSHDRALLDAMTGSTLRLSRGQARLWPGAFSAARVAWTAEEARSRDEQTEVRRRLEAELRTLDLTRRRLAASSRSRSTGVRMKSPKDSDARTLVADSRAETAERAHAAALRRSAGRSETIRAELDALDIHDEPGRDLFLRYEPCPRALVLRFSGDVLVPRTPLADRSLGAPEGAAPPMRLLREVSVVLRRDEHVVVEGRNGAGKSTLLRALLDAAALPPERVLSLPQELTHEDLRTDLETVRALAPEVRGRVLQLVHALGVEPQVLLASSSPSPGEGRKLRLALGLGRHAWLAVLDEPTNHFDLPAIERLEEALVALPGALLVVSHDARFAARVATSRWVVGDGLVRVQ